MSCIYIEESLHHGCLEIRGYTVTMHAYMYVALNPRYFCLAQECSVLLRRYVYTSIYYIYMYTHICTEHSWSKQKYLGFKATYMYIYTNVYTCTCTSKGLIAVGRYYGSLNIAHHRTCVRGNTGPLQTPSQLPSGNTPEL